MTDQILFPPLSRRLFVQGLSTALLRRPRLNILALDKDISMIELANLTMITPGYITDSTGVVWSLVQSPLEGRAGLPRQDNPDIHCKRRAAALFQPCRVSKEYKWSLVRLPEWQFYRNN